jgi:hypothetical protein
MMNLKVIYVGKGQFKKRVASHFVGHKITLQRQNLARYTCYHFGVTELMAFIA